ncbi:MAG: hypothetical protein A2991_00790 [Candidatus Terrybacteria bacterium RIFCSPLOWO2_01_FULL_58_14]|uniref:Uncharacterized protein n=2 Tax=Candidatus Terryibacteriota TaxID=1817920 RepID=A0A1G2PY16_9BACT|nr:MAG: hypothetical protein A2682_03235 [Candidatus Terrybacteria bacterium RIFCSPHIGHO2_01_FULL_58_15]OHA53217.1 MAG: hypothetical protein A2991_00790 [Candidatus Terrybacteria bacterium RIFCSPLOWO2_01_FULL_58_14]
MRQHSRLLIVLILFSLGMAGGVGFLSFRLVRAAEDFRAMKAEVADFQGRILRAGALETRWESVSEKAGVIQGAFLDRDALPQFLGSAEATAIDAGVKETTSILKEEVGNIEFRLHGVGAFSPLFVFMTHLNVLPALLFVEEVSFTAASQEAVSEQPPSVDVTIRVPIRTEADVAKGIAEEASTTANEEEEIPLDGP